MWRKKERGERGYLIVSSRLLRQPYTYFRYLNKLAILPSRSIHLELCRGSHLPYLVHEMDQTCLIHRFRYLLHTYIGCNFQRYHLIYRTNGTLNHHSRTCAFKTEFHIESSITLPPPPSTYLPNHMHMKNHR